MDINLGIGLVSIILTIVFGIIGILLTIKKKYSGKLDLIIDENINLYDSILKNISDLKMTYKNNPINKNFNLIKLFVINSGQKDLSKESTEKLPTISFGDKVQVHYINIISNSEELNISSNIINDKIVMESGLIRRNEYVYLEALVENNNEKPLDKTIGFDYRISEFEKTKPILKSNILSNYSTMILIPVALLTVYIVSALFSQSLIPLGIYEYNLNAIVENDSKKMELTYFDYSIAYSNKKWVSKKNLNNIEKKAEYIINNYNYLSFMFNLRPTEFNIDGYKVSYSYTNYLQLAVTIIYIFLLFIFLIQLITQRSKRKILTLIEKL